MKSNLGKQSRIKHDGVREFSTDRTKMRFVQRSYKDRVIRSHNLFIMLPTNKMSKL
jgi:hypothetical protein